MHPMTPAGRTDRPRRLHMIPWALAGSLLLAFGLIAWSGFGPQPVWPTAPSHTSLASAVLDHIAAEPAALDIADEVPEPTVTLLLASLGLQVDPQALGAGLEPIHYAARCRIRHHDSLHLVITGTAGPVTLSLIPNTPLGRSAPIRSEHFEGLLTRPEAEASRSSVHPTSPSRPSPGGSSASSSRDRRRGARPCGNAVQPIDWRRPRTMKYRLADRGPGSPVDMGGSREHVLVAAPRQAEASAPGDALQPRCNGQTPRPGYGHAVSRIRVLDLHRQPATHRSRTGRKVGFSIPSPTRPDSEPNWRHAVVGLAARILADAKTRRRLGDAPVRRNPHGVRRHADPWGQRHPAAEIHSVLAPRQPLDLFHAGCRHWLGVLLERYASTRLAACCGAAGDRDRCD
jgi:hypothetical protein